MKKHIMNTLKTNNIIAWQNAETAKPSFHEQSYCAVFSGNIMDFDGKQNSEYPLES